MSEVVSSQDDKEEPVITVTLSSSTEGCGLSGDNHYGRNTPSTFPCRAQEPGVDSTSTDPPDTCSRSLVVMFLLGWSGSGQSVGCV